MATSNNSKFELGSIVDLVGSIPYGPRSRGVVLSSPLHGMITVQWPQDNSKYSYFAEHLKLSDPTKHEDDDANAYKPEIGDKVEGLHGNRGEFGTVVYEDNFGKWLVEWPHLGISSTCDSKLLILNKRDEGPGTFPLNLVAGEILMGLKTPLKTDQWAMRQLVNALWKVNHG